MTRKKVILTIGDPAGCGPYVTLKALAALDLSANDIFLVGSEEVLAKYPDYKKIKRKVIPVDVDIAGGRLLPGVSRAAGAAALEYLQCALYLMGKEKIDRLVTAPVSKEAIALNLPCFTGHTEYLAAYFKVKDFAMMMVSPRLKTLLLTRHLPLNDVARAIGRAGVSAALRLLERSLRGNFRIKNPRIAFAAVNPHAGVDTFLGREEKAILAGIRLSGIKAAGPFPADTLFIQKNMAKYDCIVAAYHDQGMIPFKLLAFKEGVNFTAGLPIVRTSPAHGTAFDLMKKGGVPDHSSMLAAIKLALRLKPGACVL